MLNKYVLLSLYSDEIKCIIFFQPNDDKTTDNHDEDKDDDEIHDNEDSDDDDDGDLHANHFKVRIIN